MSQSSASAGISEVNVKKSEHKGGVPNLLAASKEKNVTAMPLIKKRGEKDLKVEKKRKTTRTGTHSKERGGRGGKLRI